MKISNNHNKYQLNPLLQIGNLKQSQQKVYIALQLAQVVMGIGQIKWVMSFIKGGQAKEVTRLIDNISILPRKVGANQQLLGQSKVPGIPLG